MNETTKRRNAEFMKTVRRVAAAWEGSVPDMKTFMNKVVEMGAPEFYVDYETAYRYVSLAMRGKLPALKNKRRQQWVDLAELVKKTMAERHDISYGHALTIVLDRGYAPSFYITPSSAKTIYYRMLKKKGL